MLKNIKKSADLRFNLDFCVRERLNEEGTPEKAQKGRQLFGSRVPYLLFTVYGGRQLGGLSGKQAA